MSGLSEEAKEQAKRELREDESTRINALAQMREWVRKNPRIVSCRMDDSFFLRFLRSKKFSVVMAQEAVERYLLLRQCWSIVFSQLDHTLPSMAHLIDIGVVTAAPGRDSLGRRWIIYRPGLFDSRQYLNVEVLRLGGVLCESLIEDEENQVRGFVHFADGAGVSFHHLTLFTPKQAIRLVKNGERIVPMRHKEVFGINVLPAIKFAVDFGLGLVSEKIKKRVKIFSSVEDALEVIGENRRMLPKEYGGEMPLEEMTRLFKKELEDKRDVLLNNDKILRVNMDMFSSAAKEGSVAALRGKCSYYNDGDRNDIGIGSFRKLEVD